MRYSCICLLLLLTGCISRDTDDAADAFRYWAGEAPSSGVVPLEGKYWKSGHWSYEYETFLHFRAPKRWRAAFFQRNGLAPVDVDYPEPDSPPEWFTPPRSGVVYGGFSGRFYVEDTARDELWVYELQL